MRQLPAIPSGRPSLTPKRQDDLGGAPLRSRQNEPPENTGDGDDKRAPSPPASENQEDRTTTGRSQTGTGSEESSTERAETEPTTTGGTERTETGPTERTRTGPTERTQTDETGRTQTRKTGESGTREDSTATTTRPTATAE